MVSRFSSERPTRRVGAARRLWVTLFPAATLGALAWLLPAESQAAPSCSSKPAVCARLAAAKKQSQPTLVVAAAPVRQARSAAPASCATKPAVCARLDARGLRPAAPPVTLASSADPGARCSSKPAVCARLRLRADAPPITLASDAP